MKKRMVIATVLLLICSLVATAVPDGPRIKMQRGTRDRTQRMAAPTRVEFTEETVALVESAPVDAVALSSQVLAGHLLRRIGFGPTQGDMRWLTPRGRTGRVRWINWQLWPEYIDDSYAESLLPAINPDNGDTDYIRRWYVRMTYSQRQLQEKMTLIWHEHFSVSDEKVGDQRYLGAHEDLLRRNSLGNFRNFLVDVTVDSAMLRWLDNDYNNGNDVKPPNENFSREFLQLFATGTTLLNLDGTPVRDASGNPVPSYTETDVRELARSLTGWHTNYCDPYPYCDPGPATFEPGYHDDRAKTIMGEDVPAGMGEDETAYAIDLVLRQRTDTVAAFISKILLQKLVSENPPPAYVYRVARRFKNTNWNIREAVKLILTDAAFESGAMVRTMYKEPVEQYVGAVRALNSWTQGDALYNWTYEAGQLVYYPPSVFSFYRPGNKASLVNTSRVFFRDKMADEYSSGWWDTAFDAPAHIRQGGLTTPDRAVTYFVSRLLAAPASTGVRSELIRYMGGQVTEEKVRGLVWLIMCSPDFQRN